MREAIEKARQRLEELDGLLADQKVLSDRNLLLKYGKERSALEPLVAKAAEFEQVEKDIRGAEEIIQTSDEKWVHLVRQFQPVQEGSDRIGMLTTALAEIVHYSGSLSEYRAASLQFAVQHPERITVKSLLTRLA